MSDPKMIERLRGVRFLAGLDDGFLEDLANNAKVVTFAAGKVLFREGDPAKSFYFVVRGSVALEICAPAVGCRRTASVGPGELLGWSPALGEATLTTTARALSDVEAVEILGTQVLAICEHNPRYGYEFMKRVAKTLSKRLSAARVQLLDVFGTEVVS